MSAFVEPSNKIQTEKTFVAIDGNEAVARVAYRLNEVIAIYPITPASPMGEWADEWSSQRVPNLWGTVPTVVEMQSEGGAAGAVHGAAQTGALATTFTASQGLLLMIPNMHKIAGELLPFVLHVAARSLATHALSIFGDHSDVMAARATGFAMLCSNSVQEAQDFALLAQATTLNTRVPFVHFFDGFRTSHEINKIELLSDDAMREMIDERLIAEHRRRRLAPEHPVIRGTAHNPDTYFQARERSNPFYVATIDALDEIFKRFASLTGRRYRLFDYYGAPDAERVIVMMGSGVETARETADYLNARGEKLGVIAVRLFRPFSVLHFINALPRSVKAIAVLDRTKESGATGEPLYLDVMSAIYEGLRGRELPLVVGGRYGLSSKEFTPAMAKAVFDNLKSPAPKNRFTVGIHDDISHSSLDCDDSFSIEAEDVTRAIFYGLGSDGTVGANKNSIKIIAENTDHYAQGYFVYDSKKSGSMTISHLRFGTRPIRAPYLISEAQFLACHQWQFIERYDMLKRLKKGGTFLLNAPHSPDEVWDKLPRKVQEELIQKEAKFYVIDAYKVARENGMAGRINAVMQTCFFAISGALPREEAIAQIKESIKKTYKKKGEAVVAKNLAAVDDALAHLYEVKVPKEATSLIEMRSPVTPDAPDFVVDVLGKIILGEGDELPVSAFPVDGTYPVGTARYEKRNLAKEIPTWDASLCVQCGKCAMICPHAAIREKVYEPSLLAGAPEGFKWTAGKDRSWQGMNFTIQVAPEDCTGCSLCVDVCPAQSKTEPNHKALNMTPQAPLREQERRNWEFFLSIPEYDRRHINASVIKQQQLQEPLFEFSGACAGCGETPYLKLLSQLFGDRAIVANATGCSSIYGGNLPTTPWSKNKDGYGPAWANSLFEDNAEFGYGFRISIDKQREFAVEILKAHSDEIGETLAHAILNAKQKTEADIYDQRERVEILKARLRELDADWAKRLLEVADMLVKKSIWIVGGDGWAYDIGYGGLDHVLASGKDVNILVLDTEVYSNTGGQASKATPRSAIAKFASGGKAAPKKDLGLMAMTYGNVYVASVAMGARDEHTLRAFLEAEAYEGVSLIIAYSHCIAHGLDMRDALHHQKAMVESGQWLLYRYNPELLAKGENPLRLDSKAPKLSVKEFLESENRFAQLEKSRPDEAEKLFAEAARDADARYRLYEFLASRKFNGNA
ncbi:MAG: pyruvate:ferredoxin (flavodoxin) oxidoreductase [Chloroherpetonaceae bacterium]|nr:pyruvate:ferredoxin (flavodoxin) oxidoreductase [Chloroherpetonaceae bacterium]MDW8437135.1 pyruvate:ferredoxin (flavodoxin) oxidoreductase [Chloroherpetonaceae bacterium]